MARWTKVVGLFTGLLFVANAFSDYVILRELHGNERSQRLVEEQQRAFFGLGGPVQVPGLDKDGKPSTGFIAQWQNVGGTRTAWAAGWASVQYFSDGVPYNFDVTKPRAAIADAAHMVVGPNGILQTAPVGVTHDESEMAKTGKGVLLAWGSLQYADIFHPEITHRGSFCMKLVPGGQSVDPITKQVTILFQTQLYRNDCNTTQ